MTKWIRSNKFSAKKYPVYYHPTDEYALAKEKISSSSLGFAQEN